MPDVRIVKTYLFCLETLNLGFEICGSIFNDYLGHENYSFSPDLPEFSRLQRLHCLNNENVKEYLEKYIEGRLSAGALEFNLTVKCGNTELLQKPCSYSIKRVLEEKEGNAYEGLREVAKVIPSRIKIERGKNNKIIVRETINGAYGNTIEDLDRIVIDLGTMKLELTRERRNYSFPFELGNSENRLGLLKNILGEELYGLLQTVVDWESNKEFKVVLINDPDKGIHDENRASFIIVDFNEEKKNIIIQLLDEHRINQIEKIKEDEEAKKLLLHLEANRDYECLIQKPREDIKYRYVGEPKYEDEIVMEFRNRWGLIIDPKHVPENLRSYRYVYYYEEGYHSFGAIVPIRRTREA